MEDQTVKQIREFNRFYTVLLGFLNRNYLDSGYSVTETRILFELLQSDGISANQLIEMLHLDKSYVSRLIRSFEQKGMIIRHPSSTDGRALIIQLTAKGQAEAEHLISMTNHQIHQLIETFDAETRSNLCEAMETIITIFHGHENIQEEKHGNKL